MTATKKLYAYYPTSGLWLPIKADSAGRLALDASNLFEDPPTNGETKKAATSNWSYDHNAAKTGVHQAGANNLATDADIATHAALASGVHGAGANTLLDTGDLEETPTDGETNKAPTSNWAYDHTRIHASRCSVYANATQELENAYDMAANLDAELYDNLGEFDPTNKTGTATATAALHLVDANASFESGDVGAQIWNTTDNTYAKVTAFNSATDLTLDRDIMVNTETYRLFRSWFKPVAAGYYAFSGVLRISAADIVADHLYVVKIIKNGTVMAQTVQHAAYVGSLNIALSWQGYLLTTDKVQMGVYQNSGGVVTAHIASVSNETILQGHRLS